MRRNRWQFVTLLALVLFVVPAMALAHGHHDEGKQQEKGGILLVAFGTSVPQAQKAFDQIEKQVKQAFPGEEVRWAFTSKIIRKKLGKQGKNLDSPVVALAKMLEDGYTNIVVASFHSLPGAEFNDLAREVQALQAIDHSGSRKLLVSWPLLSSRKNMEAVARAVLKQIPASRKPEDAVLLMGHGSEHHPGDAVYAALNYYLLDIDPNVFVGTVEGNPKLDDILPKLKKKGIKKVYLMPLMAVAGDHARNDMCGTDEESWASILKKAGFKVECILKGTAENPAIVDVWLANIKAAHSHVK